MGSARARGHLRAQLRIIDTPGGGQHSVIRRHAKRITVKLADTIHPIAGEHPLLDTDKGEGASGLHHGPHGTAGIAVEAGGEIHRQHGHTQAIDCCDDLCQ